MSMSQRSTPFSAPIPERKPEHFETIAHNIVAGARLSASAVAVFYTDTGVKSFYVEHQKLKVDRLVDKLPGAFVGTYTADAKVEDVAADIAWVADGGYVRR